ncbi:MAG: class I SAM-dependent methyltransferase [Caulobacteraceae bacterium]
MSTLKTTAISLGVMLSLGLAGSAHAQASAKRYEAYQRTPTTPTPTDSSLAMPAYVMAAVANPARPDEDKARDHDRKPAEVVAFAGVKPGDTVVDMIPGGGYFSRIFDSVVGPHGQVIAFVPQALAKTHPAAVTAAQAMATGPYSDVKVVVEPFSDLTSHGPLDVVWTSDNYHDLHNPSLPPTTALMMDRLIYSALKPGGVFIVLDHAAEPGAGLRDTGTLHRISQGTVRDEIESAGFVFDGESQVLHNAADDHTKTVFDPTIRGHTDQFVLKFKKPG